MDAILLLLLKVTLLLAVALGVSALLRGASAALRHALWTAVFVSLLALPLLSWTLPAIGIPVLSRAEEPLVVFSEPEAPAAELNADAISSGADPASGPAGAGRPLASPHVSDSVAPPVAADVPPADMFTARPSVPTRLLAVWLTGFLVALAAIVISLLRVHRIVRGAREVSDPEWRAAVREVCGSSGRPAIRLLVSSAVDVPMAGGLWRPVVFLPLSSRRWSFEQRAVVLAHETAHLVAWDPLRHVIARLALAAWWFHPLAWLAAREASAACEHACDQAVVARGILPSTYARVLLTLSESAARAARPLAALPIVPRSHLERRLMAILDDDVRQPRRRLALAVTAAALLSSGVVSALVPVSMPGLNVTEMLIPMEADRVPVPIMVGVPPSHTGWAQAQQSAAAAATAVVAGRVVDALSGAAVGGVTVRLFSLGNQTWPREGLLGQTDDAGNFEIAGIPAGPLRLSATADGYVSGGYGALGAGDTAGNRIELQAGEKLADLAIRLWPAARISGAVTDERGEPVVGYIVRLLRRQYIGARSVWMPSGQTKTDDRGRFASTNSLWPGDYLVLLPAEPTSRSSSVVSHESVFHGGGRTVATASVITLGPGERRDGIDLVTTLTPRPQLLSVAGTITAPESVRLLGYVGLVRRDAEDPVAQFEGFRALIRQDGKFSFSHVPPGDYRLRFAVFPSVAEGASASWGLRTTGKPASVSDLTTWFADLPLALTRSVTDLAVPLQPGSRIRGRVVFDGRSVLPAADVLNTILMHVIHAEARELSLSALGIPTGAVDAQGRFETVGLPPGKYVLDPNARIDNAWHAVTSVRVDGREVLAAGLDVGTADLTDVVVTFSGRTWDVSGAVRDRDGRPVPGARVIVFPRNPADRHLPGAPVPRRAIHVAADRAGVFHATGAFAGEHLAVAVAAPPDFWMAPEYLETLVPRATPVRLELGQKRSIDLRLP
jgi:beta-lactamase regulating signal transducer with metallopeptidase domain